MSTSAGRTASILLVTSASLLSSVPAAPVASAAPPDGLVLRLSTPARDEDARILGILTYTRLSLQFEEVPVRDAFAAIGAALRINIVGRWNDDRRIDSVDPDLRVTMEAEDKLALDVVEELLEQCEEFEDCTWQLRGGFVEIGTKRRLAAPPARDQRTYELTDLLIEPPTFGNMNEGGGYARCESQYVDAVLGANSRAALRAGTIITRKSKTEIMLELVEGIIETIEPGRWELGGNRDQGADDKAVGPDGVGAPSQVAARKARHWASMRAYREALIITAPDFVHRQIGGYPRPIKPIDTDTVRLVASPLAGAAAPADEAGADSAESPSTP